MEEASDCRKSKQKDQLGALDEIFHGQVGLSSDPPLVGSEKTLKLSLKMKMSWTITLSCSVEGMWAYFTAVSAGAVTWRLSYLKGGCDITDVHCIIR